MKKFIPAIFFSIPTTVITVNVNVPKSMSDIGNKGAQCEMPAGMGDIDELPFDKPDDCNLRIDYDFSVAAMLDHVD